MSFLFIKTLVLPAALLAGTSSIVRVYNDDFARSQKQNFRNNNVRVVTGWTYVYSESGTPTKKGVKSSEERFDQKGNRTEEMWYDENGASFLESSYTYNDEGVELKNIGVQMHKPFYNNWLYEIKDTTNELIKFHSQNKINKEKWVYSFDAAGNKTQEKYFDETGLLTDRCVFNYDSKGRLDEKIEFDAYDNLYRKWEYSYDENGNNTGEILYNNDSEVLKQYILKYDEKGNLTTRFEMNAKGVATQMTVFLYEFYTASK